MFVEVEGKIKKWSGGNFCSEMNVSMEWVSLSPPSFKRSFSVCDSGCSSGWRRQDDDLVLLISRFSSSLGSLVQQMDGPPWMD